MFKIIFIYFLLIHMIGDYYLQTKTLAEEKIKSKGKLCQHGLIYLLASCICILPVFSPMMMLAAILFSISHFIIDCIKFTYIKRYLHYEYPAEKERLLYLWDQFFHIACIFVVAFICAGQNFEFTVMPAVENLFDIIGIPFVIFLLWVTALLFIWKPANITIKQLLCVHKPCEGEDKADNKQTGGFIGLLERLIILILLSINQYSAIGLVLTAKSIARYNRIAEDQEFAEYYLLGTLLSTVIVIGGYLVII